MTTVQTIRTITDRAVAGLLSGVSQEVNDLASLDISTLTSEQLVEAEVKYLKTYSELANQHVANRRRHFNSLQLISRIPDEILLEVISLTPDRPASKRYFRDLHHLACVSFRWGTLIKNSPSLWAVVLTGFVAPIQALALKKSKSCALEVGSKAPEFTSGNFDFISRVAVHLYRWRSATLNVDRTDRITPLCSAAAPLLKDLSIRVNPQPSDRQYVIMDLFGGKAERLRHLTLERCWIPWDSQLLSGLESLQLINVKRDGPSLLQLMEVLRSCPNLTIFRIKQVHVGIVVSQDVAPVELKHLTSCTIVGVDSQMTQTLLARIVAPGCSSLVADWDGADADDFLGALTNWLPSVRSIIKSSSGVKLGITGSTVREGFSLYLRASHTLRSPQLTSQRKSTFITAVLSHLLKSFRFVPTSQRFRRFKSGALR
ncbi:hypothetical protein FRB95_003339 [Tulasnella sp. JGI-2019a]|nr:hypothetical protein FRB95_003339 [Tulasnella sp. JGI-2019a]